MPERFLKGKMPLVALVALMAAALAIVYLRHDGAKPEYMSYAAFRAQLDSGMVDSLSFESREIVFALASGERYRTDHPFTDTIREEALLSGARIDEGGAANPGKSAELSCLVILVGSCVYYLSKQKRSAVCKSNPGAARKAPPGIDFSCVAGQPEAIEGLRDIVKYLKDPERYRRLGARMPRGVLLYGPPGTGKTLMARALAGEAGVPFYAANGSDFVQMYVGVGAKRIRELFLKANESKQCVVFIDEIDAIGKKRSDGQDSERDQTLNALLTQMSGFDESRDIVVLAATNRLDTLDEALLRPGRFDRHIQIGMPDKQARIRILTVLGAKMRLRPDVDLSRWADQTTGFSGAALESMLNEAAIYAVRAGQTDIGADEIQRAFLSVIAGEDREDFYMDENDRRRCAVHEAGHVIAALDLLPDEPIKRVCIIPSTKGAGGYVIREQKERMATKDGIQKNIMVLYAGRAAEELLLGHDEISSGSSNDLEKATALLYRMAGTYGMDETAGLLVYERATAGLTCAVKRLSDELYARTKRLLAQKRETLAKVAELLARHESLTGTELDCMLNTPYNDGAGNAKDHGSEVA